MLTEVDLLKKWHSELSVTSFSCEIFNVTTKHSPLAETEPSAHFPVRVALATSDVQSILEIPATDEIHIEDRNETMVLAGGLAGTAEQWHIQHAKQSTDCT